MSIIHFAVCPVKLQNPNITVGPEGTLDGPLSNKYDYTWELLRGCDPADSPCRIVEIDWDDAQTAQEKTDFIADLTDALKFCNGIEKTIGDAETIAEDITGDTFTQTSGKLVWDQDDQ